MELQTHPDWYAHKDYGFLVDDQGSDNIESIRTAQLKVVEEETKHILSTFGLKAAGPYVWTVSLMRKDAVWAGIVERSTPDVPDSSRGDIVIAQCNGGDSFGFGYDWIFNESSNKIWTSEAPEHKIDVNEAFNPEGIPTLFSVFSQFRAHINELEGPDNPNSWTPDRIIRDLKNIGDYDEPLALLIRAALDDKLDERGRKLLEFIISDSSV